MALKKKPKKTMGQKNRPFSSRLAQKPGKSTGRVSLTQWMLVAALVILVWETFNFLMGNFQEKKYIPLKKVSEFTGTDSMGAPFGVFGMAVIGSHELAVADAKGSQILIFDFNGKLLRKWGKRGESGPYEFNEPSDVALGPQKDLYVLDAWNGAIKHFNLEGKFLEALDLKKLAVFYGPRQMALQDQSLLIPSNDKLVRLSLKGQIIDMIDQGNFKGASGIAVDGSGHFYAGDRGHERVREFDKEGKIVRDLKMRMEPSVLRLDSKGRIFVSSERGPCKVFNPAGELIGTLVEESKPETPLFVGSMALTPDDLIIIGLDDHIAIYHLAEK